MKNSYEKFLYRFLLCVFVALIAVPAVFAQEENNEVPVRQESITIVKNEASAPKYQITAGDILSLSIYDEPNMAQPEIVVRPDGYATIDPIGEVYVEGMEVGALTQLLQEKFKSFIIDPLISVNVKEFNPASVYIFGAVEKPGTYQQMITVSKQFADSKNPVVRTDLSLMNVISNAGGISIDADLSNLTITSKNQKQKKIDLWKFIKEGDTSQNVKLKTGDVIFVPKLDSMATINDEDFKLLSKMAIFPEKFPVRVIGEVAKGGTFDITGESPYLNTAIASASGYNLEAKKSIVIVYRKASNDKLARIYVDPFKQDFVLRPNDLIDVQKRDFMKFVYSMDYLNRIVSPFATIPGAGNSWADWFKPDRRSYYPR
jgi:polysaccharide export outer membrane protein